MANALLLIALALPVVLFWLLKSQPRLRAWTPAAVSIAVGWLLSVAWAVAAHENVAIAGAFGWVCPAVLVALTWLAWRFTKKRRLAEP
ncbi:hypothetical protein MQC88_10410 [Luteimonas sp. 50]|uniref:DUF4175 domain-containing protein n=1 Tax=Cognatiluteimonas sedimenti TaxID=2927791 RepID=A0ABT0A5X0_9GAMM|nr:hypothetical protein [Lysobacter sedimenti]MCJ0826357.1 hypothetical protein [Lysobacter sedimenti]